MHGTTITSSKLAAFEELVDELRQGGHRALVFSQFVDHLTIVRERLTALEIPYQYLDGSSTPQARAQAVEAFQAGRGDLFLISLKAGGFGLNLTSADYVVHLDPWWNPAVEDQASDRAHRIGQTRPVTVYRLVMQGSIEEKILALHAAKRDLADALLEGNTNAAALSVDDLLALVREASVEVPRAPLPQVQTDALS
jgi:SNF2 family DNA or RNA helicase